MAEEIQVWLNDNYGTDLIIDGDFGPLTKMALVMAYQIELNIQFNRGLEIDGLYGPRTSAAFITLRRGARGNITRIIQSMLYFKGYIIEPTGVFNANTQEAVEDFQQNNNLIEDGVIGKRTLDRLFL